MVLKRKRSESEFSFNSNFSTPPRPDTSSFEFSAMGPSSWTMLGSRSSTPSHLPSRTMKRFRDNRPSEAEVHQRTLNLLYSAQQHKTCEPQPQPDAFLEVTLSVLGPLGGIIEARPTTKHGNKL
ncbi:hypothetical protein OQA88_1384 [Cercophora sp. LCS_1]